MKKFNSGCYSHLYYNKKVKLKLFTAATIIFASCSTALYIPTENQSTSVTSYKELLEGREIYINKCGGCHSLIIPEKFNAEEWNKWVEDMEPKAKLSGEEKQLILKYLTK